MMLENRSRITVRKSGRNHTYPVDTQYSSSMILTYKYLLKGKRTLRQQRRFAWAVNQVWNFCVQTQRAVQRTWRDGLSPKWPSFYDLKDLAAGTSKDLGLNAQTIQNICKQFVKSRDLH